MNLEKKYTIVQKNGEVQKISLGELFSKSSKTLLYFYPKDNTPGCTIENKDFSNMYEDFLEKGVQLVGVSKDSADSHQKFIEKQDLQNALISDPDLELHKSLEAYGEKNNYGKIIQGVIRSTFLFDSEGKILDQWKNIRAKGHAQRVFDTI